MICDGPLMVLVCSVNAYVLFLEGGESIIYLALWLVINQGSFLNGYGFPVLLGL